MAVLDSGTQTSVKSSQGDRGVGYEAGQGNQPAYEVEVCESEAVHVVNWGRRMRWIMCDKAAGQYEVGQGSQAAKSAATGEAHGDEEFEHMQNVMEEEVEDGRAKDRDSDITDEDLNWMYVCHKQAIEACLDAVGCVHAKGFPHGHIISIKFDFNMYC